MARVGASGSGDYQSPLKAYYHSLKPCQAKEAGLSRSTRRQEALELSIAAAELYMKALKIAKTPQDKKRLNAKCQNLLGQAERIKGAGDVGSLSSKMVDLEVARPARKAQAIEDLSSDRKLSTKEQIILHKNSTLNGCVYPPWKAAPDPAEFRRKENEELFMYVAGFLIYHPSRFDAVEVEDIMLSIIALLWIQPRFVY